LSTLPTTRFGKPPSDLCERIAQAPAADLERWPVRFAAAVRLEQVFGDRTLRSAYGITRWCRSRSRTRSRGSGAPTPRWPATREAAKSALITASSVASTAARKSGDRASPGKGVPRPFRTEGAVEKAIA